MAVWRGKEGFWLNSGWFRTSALYMRWKEEVLLLQEEMRRTVRFFGCRRQQWRIVAQQHHSHGDAAREAYARK